MTAGILLIYASICAESVNIVVVVLHKECGILKISLLTSTYVSLILHRWFLKFDFAGFVGTPQFNIFIVVYVSSVISYSGHCLFSLF